MTTGSSMLNQHVLVLNRGWTPIGFATVKRALLMLISDQAMALDENYQTYDFASWQDLSQATTGGRRISTVATQIIAPYVVVLTDFNKVPNRTVRLSRRNIYARDYGTCQYCGIKPSRDEVSIDHIVPRSKGGRTTWENVALACMKCNNKKGSLSLVECGMKLRSVPVKPRGPLVEAVRVDSVGRGFWEKFVAKAYWNVELEQ